VSPPRRSLGGLTPPARQSPVVIFLTRLDGVNHRSKNRRPRRFADRSRPYILRDRHDHWPAARFFRA